MNELKKKATKVAMMIAAVLLTVGNQPVFGQEDLKNPKNIRPLVATSVVIQAITEPNHRVEESKRKLQNLFLSQQLVPMLDVNQIWALKVVESRNRNGLVGDKHLGSDPDLWAWGILQIRKCYIDDVNGRYGTNLYASDCLEDSILSELVVQAYMNRYAKDRSFEAMARMHNGGPSAWNPRSNAYSKTTNYWTKVRAVRASLQLSDR